MAQGTPELLKALGEIDPRQPYGTELFDALARVTVSVAVETVCLRLRKEIANGVSFRAGSGHTIATDDVEYTEIEVYLVQRSPDDTAYPGQWHCPGSVMRPGESFEDVLERLEQKEFGAPLLSKRFVANINPSRLKPEERGHFLSIVYLCVFEEKEDLRGKWFSVRALPKETVESHRRKIIPCALGMFTADNADL